MTQLIKPNGTSFVSAPFYSAGPFYLKALGLGAGILTLEMVTVLVVDSGVAVVSPCAAPSLKSTITVTSSVPYPDYELCQASPIGAIAVGGWYRIILSASTALASADVSYENISSEQAIAMPKPAKCAALVAPVVVPVYCPSYRYDSCGCNEVGFVYRNNALKDPAATVGIGNCTGGTEFWIYPASGTTADIRHEVPVFDGDGITLLGYAANQSTCVPPCACSSGSFAPSSVSSPYLVSTSVSSAGVVKSTLSDGSVIVSNEPVSPTC